MDKNQHVTTFSEAMCVLAESWKSGRFDEYFNFLMGRPSALESLGIKALNPMDDEGTAITGAITMSIVAETHQREIEISIDDLAMAKEYMKTIIGLKHIADAGLVGFSFDEFDEYGFPAITLNKNQQEFAAEYIKSIKKTDDRT